MLLSNLNDKNLNELDNSLDSIKSEKILEIEDLLCNQSIKFLIF